MQKSQLKKLARPFIRNFLVSKAGKVVNNQLGKLAEYFRYERSLYDREIAERQLKQLFSDLSVKNGPFKGLIYPSFSSFGSSIFPKLAGTYESELHRIFAELQQKDYKKIIDIGAAEGYYAVGLARIFSNAAIFAFDIDPYARELCREMAKMNGVLERIKILEACTEDWLSCVPLNENTLIISDCEGAEITLFTEQSVKNLKKTDLIIEMHPMYVRDIKERLLNTFNSSHHIHLISSFDDARKLFDLDPHYQSLSNIEKNILIQEGRSFTMEWMFLTPK